MKTLVLVEDEPLLARTFQRVFGRRDYTVIHCKTVPEARVVLQETTPDVLLLDRQVLFEDGWSLREVVGASVRVVLMTGAPPSGNTLPFFHKGVDDIQRLIDMAEGKEE